MAGHAESWDEVHIDGDLKKFDCTITYKSGDAALAVVTISRDLTVRWIYSFGVSTEEWFAFSSAQRSNSFLA
jgi:hypothetical protein